MCWRQGWGWRQCPCLPASCLMLTLLLPLLLPGWAAMSGRWRRLQLLLLSLLMPRGRSLLDGCTTSPHGICTHTAGASCAPKARVRGCADIRPALLIPPVPAGPPAAHAAPPRAVGRLASHKPVRWLVVGPLLPNPTHPSFPHTSCAAWRGPHGCPCTPGAGRTGNAGGRSGAGWWLWYRRPRRHPGWWSQRRGWRWRHVSCATASDAAAAAAGARASRACLAGALAGKAVGYLLRRGHCARHEICWVGRGCSCLLLGLLVIVGWWGG